MYYVGEEGAYLMRRGPQSNKLKKSQAMRGEGTYEGREGVYIGK
jgi:hypothetical protein